MSAGEADLTSFFSTKNEKSAGSKGDFSFSLSVPGVVIDLPLDEATDVSTAVVAETDESTVADMAAAETDAGVRSVMLPVEDIFIYMIF